MRVRKLMATLGAAMAVAATATGSVEAAEPVHTMNLGPEIIVANSEPGGCLDLPSKQFGTRPVVAVCDQPNNNSQKWMRTGEGGEPYFNIYSWIGAGCMDVGPAPAHNVVMSPCNTTTSTSQRWSIQNRLEIGAQLRNNATGTCLDYGAVGNPVVLTPCSAASHSQRWDSFLY